MRRRQMLTRLGAAAIAGPAFSESRSAPPAAERLAGKLSLIRRSFSPPNYETPVDAFRDPITANDRFFVSYHLADIPQLAVLRNNFALTVDGDAAGNPVTFTLADLRRLFKPAEITAVCQCAGNRRGLLPEAAPGVQWGPGAMGNAVWSGVRLKDVLTRAGVQPNALELGLLGADRPARDGLPLFRKSLPIIRAMEDDVIVAFAMNHLPLPHYNGFPLRLVVPGWTSTYWMKHLTGLEIRSTPLDSYWMRQAYRVPKGAFPVDRPFASQDDGTTVPVTELLVNSLITAPADGARVSARGFRVAGMAWDRGHGIRSVEVSFDGGVAWVPATLGKDFGSYAFRPFSLDTGRLAPGRLTLLARATSQAGEHQTGEHQTGEHQTGTLKADPGGYLNNAPLAVSVRLA